jgi:IS30 family transposase
LADARANELLVSARVGVDLTEDELALIVYIAKPLLDNGLAPASIWAEHGDRLPCSERSFYRYVNDGDIKGIIRMDLPAAKGYKERKRARSATRANLSKEALEGRTYQDFLLLPKEVRDRACEMDCVCGLATDSQAILTLFFRKFAFQLMVLVPHKDSLTIDFTLDEVETYMAGLFPDPLLTDRGSEFADAAAIEASNILADRRCSLYYCDPRRSDQKARCENAHRLIRRVLPKGTSFEELTDQSVALLCSHVNSVPRTSLGGKPPMLQAMEHLPKELFEGYGIELVPTDKIILKPKLLGL